MLPECTTRAFDGCSCTDQCQSKAAELDRRIQNLGTVRRSSDMTGVFTDMAKTTIAATAFVALSLGICFAIIEGHQEQQRMDRIVQEMGR